MKSIKSKYFCENCDQNTIMIKEDGDSLLLECNGNEGCGGMWSADAKHMKEYYEFMKKVELILITLTGTDGEQILINGNKKNIDKYIKSNELCKEDYAIISGDIIKDFGEPDSNEHTKPNTKEET